MAEPVSAGRQIDRGFDDMKIMFAVPSYWPSQDGVANITGYLAEGLAGRGHEVLCFTSAGDGGRQKLPETESHSGVSIERMRVYVRWPLKLKGRDRASTKKAYLEKIKSYHPDILIVVCSQTWTLDWVKGYLDSIPCPKVFYSHGYSGLSDRYAYWEKLRHRNILGVWEEYLRDRYYKNLYRTIRKFDLAIYLSELNNAYLYSEKYGLTNGEVLENAIEGIFLSETMEHKREQFFRPELHFLYVANYNVNKNQDMLLKVFCEAKMEHAVLHLVGFEENDYLTMLRQHLVEWLPEDSGKKVIFHVHLTREQVYELYRTCDVFVSTSRSENCPIVHCEAAATGMAVISTDVGDVRLKEGILLADDEMSLQQAMEHLYQDREELSDRGGQLRRYMLTRKCRVEEKVDWLEAKLERLIQEKQNGVNGSVKKK